MAKRRATGFRMGRLLARARSVVKRSKAEELGAVRALVAVRRPVVAMHHFLVAAAMMDLAIPMLCRVVRMAHQRPTRAVPRHLPVTQPVAPALRLAQRTRRV